MIWEAIFDDSIRPFNHAASVLVPVNTTGKERKREAVSLIERPKARLITSSASALFVPVMTKFQRPPHFRSSSLTRSGGNPMSSSSICLPSRHKIERYHRNSSETKDCPIRAVPPPCAHSSQGISTSWFIPSNPEDACIAQSVRRSRACRSPPRRLYSPRYRHLGTSFSWTFSAGAN